MERQVVPGSTFQLQGSNELHLGTRNRAGGTICVPLVGGAPIIDATFIARPNRFVIEAELALGEHVLAHCADRGRLLWLVPGTSLLLGAKGTDGRKTSYQAAAQINGGWTSLDTHLPNRLIKTALQQRALPPFAQYSIVQSEARYGSSRFDFRLSDDEQICFLETKSVGIAHDGVGLFPDAPTERGRRHVEELAALRAAGVRAALVFVAQHTMAQAVTTDRLIDPFFAEALASAEAAGVEVYAWRCPVGRDGITLENQIPCIL